MIRIFALIHEKLMFSTPALAGIYLLKVNNTSTRTRCKIYSKLTIKTLEPRYWCGSRVFIVNFEHISQLVLVFLLLTLNMQLPAGVEHRACPVSWFTSIM